MSARRTTPTKPHRRSPMRARKLSQHDRAIRAEAILDTIGALMDRHLFGDGFCEIFLNNTDKARELAKELGLPYVTLAMLYNESFPEPLLTPEDVQEWNAWEKWQAQRRLAAAGGEG